MTLIASAIVPPVLLGQGIHEPGTANAPTVASRTVGSSVPGQLGPPGVSLAAVTFDLRTLDGPRAAPVVFPAARPDVFSQQRDNVRMGPNIAMMAAGGAALVTGLVIGGDGGLIIATAGGVVGLVGLYRYLR